MTVSTFSAAWHIAPVFIKTFLAHGQRKAKRINDVEQHEDETARDADILFDEGFNIVKAFIKLGTENTVESLQSFTNTHVPSPYWSAVAPILIPLCTANHAADILKSWFSEEELKLVVGGERWWQVRGLDGIEAEWITEKEFLMEELPDHSHDHKLSSEEEIILKMDHLNPVMLYIHGGGYFWGSINTHRYQLLRMAHKMRGRVFAPNYRKAPQYPWPCPIHDILSAYFYLIDPPSTALHSPIPPSKIVLAGDSAGGGLVLTLLTILRDLHLPLPAGAILISPWVDLTHSFPSVMNNTSTDIVPPHGFLARPSPLWPPDPIPPVGGRVAPAEHGSPPKPGHADTLKPSSDRLRSEERRPVREVAESQNAMLSEPEPQDDASTHSDFEEEQQEVWEPIPPKVLMKDPNAVPLELRSQIQLYATTEQLSHPLVSPVLQGSLGSLPPLYIIAGNGEMLRDEIIYTAHKAARPTEYPTRKGVLLTAHRQKENAEKFQIPTNVHLQVYDDMCHVLTVFTFTKAAKHAYRSIAKFANHITTHDKDYLSQHSFPPAVDLSSASSSSSNISISAGIKSLTPPNVSLLGNMLRERVSIDGVPRSMEDPSQIQALNIAPSEIGIIKEDPCLRWFEGQKVWDQRYHRQAASALKKRDHFTRQFEQLLRHARAQGLVHVLDTAPESSLERRSSSASARTIDGRIQEDRRWGPLDLADDVPPPSAIVGRRDTHESLALLKKHIFYAAPRTHLTVPKFKASDVLKAAFDPSDNPVRPPKQPEAQTIAHFIPFHGIRMWNGIVTYFMKKSSKKARAAIKEYTSDSPVSSAP